MSSRARNRWANGSISTRFAVVPSRCVLKTPASGTRMYTAIVSITCSLLLVGCVSSRRVNSSSDDVTWRKLVESVSQLQWSEADQGAAFKKAQKELGLDNYSKMQLSGGLFVANGKRNAVQTHPWPEVWKTETQKLLCAGDLCGDGKTKYVLGCGWFGPMGGVVCVYDEALRKIAEVSLDDVFALKLEDVTGDGRLDILCWQDQHNGTDGWRRNLTIFRLSKTCHLKSVWEGSTYAFSNAGGNDVTKHKIRILRTRDRPAVIETKEIYSRGTHVDDENGSSYSYLETPYTITRYVWNPISETFVIANQVE